MKCLFLLLLLIVTLFVIRGKGKVCDCDVDCASNCVGWPDGVYCHDGECGCLTDEECENAPGGSYCRHPYCGCRDTSDCSGPQAAGPECDWSCGGTFPSTTGTSIETTSSHSSPSTSTQTQTSSATHSSTVESTSATIISTSSEESTSVTTISTSSEESTSVATISTSSEESTSVTTILTPSPTTFATKTSTISTTGRQTTSPVDSWEGECSDSSDCGGTAPVCDEELAVCVEEWVVDISDMIDNRLDSLYISSILGDNLEDSYNTDSGVGSGTIEKLAKLLPELIQLRSTELIPVGVGFDRDSAFSHNCIHSLDIIFQSYTGWRGISSFSARHRASADYLRVFEQLGNLFGSRHQTENFSVVFEGNTVRLQVDVDDNIDTTERCFISDIGSLCVDLSQVSFRTRTKNIFAASSVKTKFVDSDFSMIFPNKKEGDYEKSRLGVGIMGLTINNEAVISNNKFVQNRFITNIYKDIGNCSFVARDPSCVYLNMDTATWSDDGCEFDQEASSKSVFTCKCQHLTNFGILFDWQGTADPSDPVLMLMSYVTLSVSCTGIILAEILQYFTRRKINNPVKRHIEMNRNFSLFLAQLSFMVFLGLYEYVSCMVCEVLGSIVHLLWLAVFCWLGLEGYFLYSSLVNVFDSRPLLRPLAIAIGYGTPLLIVIPVLLSGLTLHSGHYLKRNDEGQVQGCFLNGLMILTLIAPAGIVIVFNAAVSSIAMKIAYSSGGKRNIGRKRRVMGAIRNMTILSFLLGITWIVGFLPSWIWVQYAFVIINGSTGFFILLFTILSNTQASETVKKRFRLAMQWSSHGQGSDTSDRSTARLTSTTLTTTSNSIQKIYK